MSPCSTKIVKSISCCVLHCTILCVKFKEFQCKLKKEELLEFIGILYILPSITVSQTIIKTNFQDAENNPQYSM